MTLSAGVLAALWIWSLVVRVDRLELAANLRPGKWNR